MIYSSDSYSMLTRRSKRYKLTSFLRYHLYVPCWWYQRLKIFRNTILSVTPY